MQVSIKRLVLYQLNLKRYDCLILRKEKKKRIKYLLLKLKNDNDKLYMMIDQKEKIHPHTEENEKN